jgi:NADPH:quinone reductase-like Zn-dependent oxidoreductase
MEWRVYQQFINCKVEEKNKVLVIGASGGVGNFLVQLSKGLGAFVTGICSNENLERVVGFSGADQALDYQKGNWWEEKEKYDVVFDTVGGKEMWEHAQLVLKKNGRFVTIVGDNDGMESKVDVPHLMESVGKVIGRKSLSIISKPKYYVLTETPDLDDLEKLRDFVQNGQLNPLVGPKFPIKDIIKALKICMKGKDTKGTVIVLTNFTEE